MPSTSSTTLVVGGTSGLGLAIAESRVRAGQRVIVTGRDGTRAAEVAERLGPLASSTAFDLADPSSIAPALAMLGEIDHVVCTALERDRNNVRDYEPARAVRLVTLKLVGYTEVVHTLATRIPASPASSILLFGGNAKDVPYPGSTTVSTVNAAVDGLMRSLLHQLAPVRVNCIHPGIVGDTPFWANLPERVAGVTARTPTRRITRTDDIVHAVTFLLDNQAMNGAELCIDGGVRHQVV